MNSPGADRAAGQFPALKTLMLGPDEARTPSMNQALEHCRGTLAGEVRVGQLDTLESAIRHEAFELIFAEIPLLDASGLDRLEVALSQQPGCAVLLGCADASAQFLLGAMRAGVREVLPADASVDALAAALMRQAERLGAARSPARRLRVIAFMPAKGGSGATFLATNLAYALAQGGSRVAVIDLNLQFGDVPLCLSERKPTTSIADLAREWRRLDGELLESSMMRISENLRVLAAPESPERSMEVRPEVVERVIALCRGRFDFVILDVGRVLESVSIRALDEAHTVYVVIQAAVPMIQDARRLISVLQGLGYGREKLKIVVNRSEAGGDIGAAEIARTLGFEVERLIPNSYGAVLRSVNHGIPILLQSPKDPVARALLEWAQSLAPENRPKQSWLREWLGARL